jgi:hypothetical protein
MTLPRAPHRYLAVDALGDNVMIRAYVGTRAQVDEDRHTYFEMQLEPDEAWNFAVAILETIGNPYNRKEKSVQQRPEADAFAAS